LSEEKVEVIPFTTEAQRTQRKDFFICPAKAGQIKRFLPGWGNFSGIGRHFQPGGNLWRIGISRFSIATSPLRVLCVSNESFIK